MSRDKQFRLHHKERLKKKRKSYDIVELSENPRYIGLCIKTPSFCDCIYCKNPRKYYKGNSKKSQKFRDLKYKEILQE